MEHGSWMHLPVEDRMVNPRLGIYYIRPISLKTFLEIYIILLIKYMLKWYGHKFIRLKIDVMSNIN